MGAYDSVEVVPDQNVDIPEEEVLEAAVTSTVN